jgi:hypothetical protein
MALTPEERQTKPGLEGTKATGKGPAEAEGAS